MRGSRYRTLQRVRLKCYIWVGGKRGGEPGLTKLAARPANLPKSPPRLLSRFVRRQPMLR